MFGPGEKETKAMAAADLALARRKYAEAWTTRVEILGGVAAFLLLCSGFAFALASTLPESAPAGMSSPAPAPPATQFPTPRAQRRTHQQPHSVKRPKLESLIPLQEPIEAQADFPSWWTVSISGRYGLDFSHRLQGGCKRTNPWLR
jgi:hypothetical protein